MQPTNIILEERTLNDNVLEVFSVSRHTPMNKASFFNDPVFKRNKKPDKGNYEELNHSSWSNTGQT